MQVVVVHQSCTQIFKIMSTVFYEMQVSIAELPELNSVRND